MRSHTLITRLMSCSMSTTVMPLSRIWRMSWASPCFSAGLKPAAGSSSSSTVGTGGHRPGDLQAALVAVRKVAGNVVGVVTDTDEVEQPLCLFPAGSLLSAMSRHPEQRTRNARVVPSVRADEHVLEGCHVGEQPDVLERARDPRLGDAVSGEPNEVATLEQDASLGGLIHAGDAVEHRRLAGAVRADDPEDLAPLNAQ